MRSFWLFLKAVARHWWSLMAAVVFAVFRFVPIFRSQPIPSWVYWLGILVSLFFAFFLAWRDEHRRAESLSDPTQLKARPIFIGHLYQFNIHPRTGVAPPKMLQEALDIYAKAHGQPKTEFKVDCDVFMEAYIVNERLSVGTIVEYELEIEIEGQSVKLKSERGFNGWVQTRSSYRIDAITGNKMDEPLKQEEVPDLMILSAKPMQQGHGVEGWLHFVVKDVNPLKLEKNPAKLKLPTPLKAMDGYGMEHPIIKGWKGERETAIAPDAHSN